MIPRLSQYLQIGIRAALLAGEKILAVYANDFSVEMKEDKTPVTLADKLSNETIEKELFQTGIPVLGEEGYQIPYEERNESELIWVVDPLDGTKEFIKRNGEFTVNIALIQKGKPILGIIYSPVFKDLYYSGKGIGAFKLDRHKHIELGSIFDIPLEGLMRQSMRLPFIQENKFTVVASRSHLSSETFHHIEKKRKEYGEVEITNTGSSIKMCWVAEGRAHEYPRAGRTMEWDTAAGQCIVEESGGEIVDWQDEKPLIYNKPNVENPWFIARRKFTT
jgi:3'(2'), 5'-bisphosphate nucleotidase